MTHPAWIYQTVVFPWTAVFTSGIRVPFPTKSFVLLFMLRWQGYVLDDRGIVVRILARSRQFFLLQTSKPVLELIQRPIHLAPSVLYTTVKRPGSETDHLPPSNAKVKNEGSYTFTHQYVFTLCTETYLISRQAVVPTGPPTQCLPGAL